MLRLSSLGLTEVPPAVAGLPNLVLLDLGDNQLTGLPDFIADLADLSVLRVDGNRLTEFPEAVGSLRNLVVLNLAHNHLPRLSPALGGLPRLEELVVSSNELAELPETIGQLSSLRLLDAPANRLVGVPESIGRLTRLTRLDLRHNHLTDVPNSLARLTELSLLLLDGNPLTTLPAAVVAGGASSLISFLRAGQADTQRVWRSKLLIVGQGGVGKTSLLKALAGDKPDPYERTTHGLNIRPLVMLPPSGAETMELSVWDFGGQDIYHATHQFFLTDQSLFLLVWSAREGWESSRVRYWLDTIAARTAGPSGSGTAPVIVVATNAENRAPDLPTAELRRDYPQIVDFINIDTFSESPHGLRTLRRSVARAAADLPLMGSAWPTTWLEAQTRIRAAEATHVLKAQFADMLRACGIDDPSERESVTATLHALGDILHYGDDPELSAIVVLKPRWLSERIAAILDSDAVADRNGLVLGADIATHWSDVEPDLRGQLLSMMDRYDVSYRVHGATRDDAKAIVVDRLPWNPPEYEAKWRRFRGSSGLPAAELRLRYVIGPTVPPGIPGWFIAHAHQFATTEFRPWRTGVLLEHEGHLGLLELKTGTVNTVELAVRGPRPAGFLGILDLYFVDAVLRRYPGLDVARNVPCPCRPDCPMPWPYDSLVALHDSGTVETVMCIHSLRSFSIAQMISGITPARSTAEPYEVLAKSVRDLESNIGRLTATVLEQNASQSVLAERAEQLHLLVARFTSRQEVRTPTLFTLVERPRHLPGTHRYLLRLYCAQPNAIHQLPDDRGLYRVTTLDDALYPAIRRATVVASLLAKVTGLTGSILGLSAKDLLGRNAEDLKKMQEALAKFHESSAKALDSSLSGHDLPDDFASDESDARRIEELLNRLDPHREWGGLSKTTTPAGLTLYLCSDHARAYRQPSPLPAEF